MANPTTSPSQQQSTDNIEKFPDWQDEVQAPDLSHIITEDDTPMDNIFSEKQQRLLVSSIYSSFSPGIPFLATANVGLFYGLNKPPLVPDVLLSLEVEMPQDWSQKQNRSYFVWQLGKPPELAIEIVSNKVGKELGSKLKDYAHAGVAYYVIFDPLQQILRENEKLRIYQLQGGQYVEFESHFLELIELGLTLWDGTFEGQQQTWLRWCDREGEILRTGDERAEFERQRAENERQRAERLAQLLRERGINFDEEL
jgi:Uma2 family endonuclease